MRELLPTRFDRIEQVVKDTLSRDSAAGEATLPGFAWHLVGSGITDALHKALDCDVFGLIARAWCVARELHTYTDRTTYPPDREATVFLGKHSLATNVHPVLTVSIGPIKERPLRFTLEIAADFRSAALTIRSGHIVAIAAGDCSVGAQLKYGELKLHERLRSRQVKLSDSIKLAPPGLAIA